MRTKEHDLFAGANLWDLRVFQTLAEVRNTTATAERLGVTQSAVSQAIARLEKWLGAELFDRSVRPMRVTHAGEILRVSAAGILQSVLQAADEIRAGVQGAVPMLRLGLIDTFAAMVGHEVVKALIDRVERLQIWSGITPTLTSELLNRSVDIIVCNDPMLPHTELQRICLFREPFIAAVPTAYSGRLEKLSLSEMCATLPFVRFSARSYVGQSVEYYLSQRKLNPRRTMEFDASEAVLRMVSEGLGWAIATPLCLLQAHVQSLELVTLPLPNPQAYRSVYMVWRTNELSQITPEIIEILQQSIERLILPESRRLAPWEFINWAVGGAT